MLTLLVRLMLAVLRPLHEALHDEWDAEETEVVGFRIEGEKDDDD